MKERTIKFYRTEIIKNNIFNWNADWWLTETAKTTKLKQQQQQNTIVIYADREFVGAKAIAFDSIQADLPTTK